jgi:hypothetical protein
MNTIKGMIKDLRREETHIGGCTTEGELIIALESLERSVELPYNATNGDIIKTMFPNLKARKKAFEIEVNVDKNKVGNISVDWWNAPYNAGSEE